METTEIIIDERLGQFTSSRIGDLMTNGRAAGSVGKPFDTYVQEKKWELMAGRSLQSEVKNAPPLNWGNLCESIAHSRLGLEYQLVSKTRYKHEFLPWSGMPDGLVNDKIVTDIKCPWTLGSFMKQREITNVDQMKKISPGYYWQLISNAILTKIYTCELILFMPKRSSLDEIRTESANHDNYYFHTKGDFELPWTADESNIPEITKISFEAPLEDCEALTERVEMATKQLNEI